MWWDSMQACFGSSALLVWGQKCLSHASSVVVFSTLSRRVDLFVRHLTTTSTRLLYLIFSTGLLLSGLAAGLIIYYIFRYTFLGIGVSGFTSIIVSIWFFGGLITLILGILAVYIANILAETKQRPYTVVRRLYGGAQAEPAAEDIVSTARGVRARMA